MPWLTCILALISLNAITFLCFWLDKRRAQNGGWRVRESNLLTLSFLGGTPAAFYARHVLRHKTRKEPFSTQLQLISMMQVGMIGGLGIYAFLKGF